MQNYDDDYYFIQQKDDDRLPVLTADENTVARNYTFELQSVGAAPFVFFNGAKDYQKKLGVSTLRDLPDILFAGNNLVVCTHIRDSLVALDLPGVFIHPAVFIDDDGRWHEDYWYLTFPQRFDCWDREKSDYEEQPLELGGFKLHSVYTYALDSAVLDRIPLNERLLFKMGGTQDAFIVCHQDIASIFRGNGESGAKLVSIPDY